MVAEGVLAMDAAWIWLEVPQNALKMLVMVFVF